MTQTATATTLSAACSFSVAFRNEYKFTGKERDTESGLDYFEARYYGSSLGRLMTPDWAAKPVSVPYAEFGDPQSLNLYAYVRNNPLARTDPTGHWCVFGMGATCSQSVPNNKPADPPLAQNPVQITPNADGTSTATLTTTQAVPHQDSNGSTIMTTTTTTTTVQLDGHNDVISATNSITVTNQQVDAKGNPIGQPTTLPPGGGTLSPFDQTVQGMRGAAKTPLQHDATDWLTDIPVAGKFLKRAVDALGGFTYQDAITPLTSGKPYGPDCIRAGVNCH